MFTITIGLLGLTVMYVGMIIALHYLLPTSIDCLSSSNFNSGVVEDGDNGDDVTNTDTTTQELECQTEAVDNTILNWSSNFFISICFFMFAFQLSCCPSSSSSSIKKGRKKAKAVKDTRVCYKSAILSQIFMGGSFLLTGISSIMVPNSGLDDNHGLMGYFILEIISNIFFTFSALCMAQFALDTTKNIDPALLRNTCCFCWCNSTSSKIWIAVCELLLVLSLSGILTGNIWCSTDPTLQVNDVNDVWLPTTTDNIAVCYTVTKYSDIVFHFSYALLWLPVGYLLRVASLAKPVTVLGLPTPISVVLAVIIQWTIGSMLIVVVFIIASILNKINNNNDDDDEDFYTIYFMIWNTIYGTVLYHWGMLITMYCLHNLSYGLTVPDRDDEDDIDEGPSVLSTEWWLTMLAFILPAETRKKKKKRNDDTNDDNVVEEEDEAGASATENKRVVSFEEVDYIVEEEIDV